MGRVRFHAKVLMPLVVVSHVAHLVRAGRPDRGELLNLSLRASDGVTSDEVQTSPSFSSAISMLVGGHAMAVASSASVASDVPYNASSASAGLSAAPSSLAAVAEFRDGAASHPNRRSKPGRSSHHASGKANTPGKCLEDLPVKNNVGEHIKCPACGDNEGRAECVEGVPFLGSLIGRSSYCKCKLGYCADQESGLCEREIGGAHFEMCDGGNVQEEAVMPDGDGNYVMLYVGKDPLYTGKECKVLSKHPRHKEYQIEILDENRKIKTVSFNCVQYKEKEEEEEDDAEEMVPQTAVQPAPQKKPVPPPKPKECADYSMVSVTNVKCIAGCDSDNQECANDGGDIGDEHFCVCQKGFCFDPKTTKCVELEKISPKEQVDDTGEAGEGDKDDAQEDDDKAIGNTGTGTGTGTDTGDADDGADDDEDPAEDVCELSGLRKFPPGPDDGRKKCIRQDTCTDSDLNQECDLKGLLVDPHYCMCKPGFCFDGEVCAEAVKEKQAPKVPRQKPTKAEPPRPSRRPTVGDIVEVIPGKVPDSNNVCKKYEGKSGRIITDDGKAQPFQIQGFIGKNHKCWFRPSSLRLKETTAEASVVEGDGGANDCPSGYTNILTASECSTAASALGLDDESSNDENHNLETRPKGCFSWSAGAYFNPNSGTPSDPHEDTAPICQQAQFVQGDAAGNDCPDGYTNILTASECSSAASVLGFKDKSNNDESHNLDTRPKGCFSWKSGAYFNSNTGTPSNPHEETSPICQQAEDEECTPSCDSKHKCGGKDDGCGGKCTTHCEQVVHRTEATCTPVCDTYIHCGGKPDGCHGTCEEECQDPFGPRTGFYSNTAMVGSRVSELVKKVHRQLSPGTGDFISLKDRANEAALRSDKYQTSLNDLHSRLHSYEKGVRNFRATAAGKHREKTDAISNTLKELPHHLAKHSPRVSEED